MMKTFSIDTETSYTKTRGIRQLGVRNYLSHPDTDIFMLSVYGDDFAWVGEPSAFDWSMLAGQNVVAHNFAFDGEVVAELRRRGLTIPEFQGNCTADLAAFLQSPRSLQDASRELLGIQLDKTVRDEMRGKDFHSLSPGEKTKWAEYSLFDAKASFMLWRTFNHLWPEHERAVSRHTAMMCNRGIGIDLAKVTAGIEKLQQARFEAEQKIPWAGELDAKGKEIATVSPKAMAAECRRLGIEPPASTDSKSEEFDAWLDEHEEKAPFVKAMSDWRKANRLLAVLESMQVRTCEDRLRYSVKYFGAPHTGHWAGDNGLNLLNLPRKPFAGVDVRACLVPPPGKKLVVADLSQVQARILLWLAGDEKMLDLIRSGVDLYEAHARATMGYADPRALKDVDAEKRQFAKMRVLQLGFGCGAARFQSSAATMYKVKMDLTRAQREVDDYRRKSPGITRLWDTLDKAARSSRGGDFACILPSGRTINYFKVALASGELTARVERGGARKKVYGGLLTQNLVAGTNRDILAEAVLKIESAGIPVCLHVHDEVVCEVDADAAEDAARTVREIMTTPPAWAEGLPLGSDVKIMDFYQK